MSIKTLRSIISGFSIFPPDDAPARKRLLRTLRDADKYAQKRDISSHFWAVGNILRRSINKGL